MIDSGAPYPDEFERQIQDCLTYLYDSTWLQQNALVRRLVPDVAGIERAQAFRRMIIDLVASLAADGSPEMHSKQRRVYSILQLRYIEEQAHQGVSQQLGLSERQYYREHRRALQAIAALLWERLSHDPSATISVLTESQRVRTQADASQADLETLLAKAFELTRDIAAARDLSVTLALPSRITAPSLNYAALRQLVVWIMFRLIIHSAPGSQLTAGYELSKHELWVRFELRGAITNPDQLLSTLENHETSIDLRDTLQSRLTYVLEPDGLTLTLAVPAKQDTILIIDDNPDAISLIQRHLGSLYQTVVARQASEGLRLARETQPLAIILDILLPNTDGWEILVNLKAHPDTTAIPILVCSVLKTPDLAYSLGADGYLKKPPDRRELLDAIARLKP